MNFMKMAIVLIGISQVALSIAMLLGSRWMKSLQIQLDLLKSYRRSTRA